MSKSTVIQKLESKYMKKDIPDFRVGDTVRVHVRIIEGEKERIQVFTGTVIARTGYGISETISLHRVAYGVGMERVFPIHSPRIAKIELAKAGKVRRAKLYYLRGASGKKARVQGDVGARRMIAASATAPAVTGDTESKEAQEKIMDEAAVETPATESESGEPATSET